MEHPRADLPQSEKVTEQWSQTSVWVQHCLSGPSECCCRVRMLTVCETKEAWCLSYGSPEDELQWSQLSDKGSYIFRHKNKSLPFWWKQTPCLSNKSLSYVGIPLQDHLALHFLVQSAISVVMPAATKYPAGSEKWVKQWVILRIMPNKTFKFNLNQNE